MKLTSEISEINRLSVGIQELNHRVVAVLDSAADGGDVSLHHRHIFGNQILTITFGREQRWETAKSEMMSASFIGKRKAPPPPHAQRPCTTRPAAQRTGHSAKTILDFSLTGLTEEELVFSARGTLGRQRRNISRRAIDPGSCSQLGLYGNGSPVTPQ